MTLFDLRGRRALITGSSQGIGLALARALGSAGAAVVLNGRDTGKLAAAAAALRGEGVRVETAAFDVTDPTAVATAVDRLEDGPGGLDVLVNNAGIQRRAPLEDFPEATWHELMRTNLDSVFYVAQAVGRRMIARGRGKIINICSVQSELGRPGITPYAASKGAVKMLTKGMCAEWARHGLQINGIGPGYFATELTQALVADFGILRLAVQANAGRPMGSGRGAGGRCDLPCLRRFRFCQRADHLRRWRYDQRRLSIARQTRIRHVGVRMA